MPAAMNPFTPGATATLSATTSSSNAALSNQAAAQNVGGQQCRIAAPAGGSIAFIKFGTSSVTAAVTDTPILPGSVEMFTIPANATHVAVITGTSTQTLYVTTGYGG